jgi:hypothetical protein
MSEQELIRALQELVARHARPAEPRQLISEIVSRDRRRVGLLAGLTSLLWLCGIAGLLYMVFWFNRFIIAYTPRGMDRAGSVLATDELHAQMDLHNSLEEFHAMMELHHSLEGCMVAVPALLLGALGTVWLVFSSRRATLNQINLSLAEISEQLRQMRQVARPPEGG